MTPNEFVKRYYPFAKQVEDETTIPAIAILAQAALESAWGNKAIGNNIFGIKFKKGDYGYKKVLTTEYSDKPDLFKGEDLVSVIYDFERGKYKYKVYQYFADYKTPYDAFLAHSKLLLSERYISALKYKEVPELYIAEVAKCGYASDPNYSKKMAQMVSSIKKRL